IVTRRSDGKLQDLSESVNKVRRTASGNLLLELSRGSNSSAVMMKKDLESVLEGAAAVRALSEDTRVQFLVVSDLDPLVVAEDLTKALVDQFDVEANAVNLKSLRPSLRDTQSATVGLPCKEAKAVLAKGKLKVGWTVCRVRESESKPRCLKCLEIGHIAARCASKVGQYWIYSCYLAPSLSLATFGKTIDEICADARGKLNVLLAGDFNAWAVDWGSQWTNARGRIVVGAVASLDLVLLNEGSQQTFNRAGAGSVIDLTFASPSLARQAFWRI
ncbi:hypothetical protein KR084_001948, partial [Drosophila pseudotakahashii]